MDDYKVHGHRVRVMKGDLTDLDVDAIVLDARGDLELGAGYARAIAIRGGPAVQAELKKMAPVPVGHAVVSGAGNLKARCIIHAVGPKFQEENEVALLRHTVTSALRAAEEHGVRRLALPPLGTGFYGMPIDRSARVIVSVLKEHLRGPSGLEEIVICVLDNKDVTPFEAEIREAASGSGCLGE